MISLPVDSTREEAFNSKTYMEKGYAPRTRGVREFLKRYSGVGDQGLRWRNSVRLHNIAALLLSHELQTT